MNRKDLLRSLKSLFLVRMPKALALYVLCPVLCLVFLAGPIANAVRGSATAAFLILLAGFGAIALNWLVYYRVHRKQPSLLVYAYGLFCLLALVLVEYEALPAYAPLASTLAIIAGAVVLVSFLLLSWWLAARRSRPAHVFAVGLWITIGLILVFMAYQIFRDIESRQASADTWITLGLMLGFLLLCVSPRILASLRLSAFRRRASGLAEGRIAQIIGETHLDLDDDQVTLYHVRVEYSVDGIPYETRTDMTRYTLRKFGRDAFIGRKIPVHYIPGDPGKAFADRIDRHFFEDHPQEPETPPDEEPSV